MLVAYIPTWENFAFDEATGRTEDSVYMLLMGRISHRLGMAPVFCYINLFCFLPLFASVTAGVGHGYGMSPSVPESLHHWCCELAPLAGRVSLKLIILQQLRTQGRKWWWANQLLKYPQFNFPLAKLGPQTTQHTIQQKWWQKNLERGSSLSFSHN